MLRVNQLCGFGVGSLARVTTLAQQNLATSTAATITAPSDIVAGDLLVLWDAPINSAGTPTAVTPAGFTQITNITATLIRGIASYKIANGSEASASISGMNGTSANRKILYTFRGNVPITTATLLGLTAEGTDGNPAAQVCSAGSGTPPLVVLGCYYGTPSLSGASFTPAEDASTTTGARQVSYKIYNSAPADTTVDLGDGGSNLLASFYLQVS